MELKSNVDAISVTIDENKLVTVRPSAGYNINLEDIKCTYFWAVNELKPKKLNAMVVGSQGITFDPEVRKFLRSKEFQKHIAHYALVVSNMSHRLIVNVLFKIKKPSFDYRVFTSEEKAIEWLLSKK